MSLRLPDELRLGIEALEPELLAAAQAIGLGVLPKLTELKPGLTDTPAGASAALDALDLDRDGAPDPLSAAAVLAAHQAYVRQRGRADGLSLGALSLARLLVWVQRAAMLGGPSPQIVWVGPESRLPDGLTGTRLVATATITGDGRRRSARAVAIVQAAPASA